MVVVGGVGVVVGIVTEKEGVGGVGWRSRGRGRSRGRRGGVGLGGEE